MIFGESTIQETHYDILSVREDASYEEIRTGYRSAILNYHPDKLQKTSEPYDHDNESGDRFLKVQKAWEILSNSRSRAMYDSELRASRQDTVAAEDVSLEDMTIEDNGDVLDLFYQCRCGDYFSIDSTELDKMGYTLLKSGNKICLQSPDTLPASVVLPCGSCSLYVRLLVDADVEVTVDGIPCIRVFDGVKIISSMPEAPMAEMNTAIANLEYARATARLDSPSSSLLKNSPLMLV